MRNSSVRHVCTPRTTRSTEPAGADPTTAMLSQAETLRQKAGVIAVIEELGKLEPLMAEAAVEEVASAREKEKAIERLRAERRAQRDAEAAAKQVGHAVNNDRAKKVGASHLCADHLHAERRIAK